MSVIYLLKTFNNYYNRRVIKYDTVNEYLNAVGQNNYVQRGTSAVTAGGYGPINFNINDGVSATMTYNYIDGEEWQPDYILVCDDTATNILYRFFVLEAKRTRKYQYILTLRRDVIADHYDAVINADTYLERGSLSLNDYYIFNQEPIKFNQIKQNETLLKDTTGCPWIVGFIASNQPEGTESALAGMYQGINSTTADKTYDRMSAAPFWNYLTDYGLDYWPYKVIATSGYNTYFFFTLKFDVSDRNQSVYFTYKYSTTEGLSVFECYIDALTSHSPYALYGVPQYANGTVIRSGNIYDLMVNMKNSITNSMIEALISYSASAGNLKTPAQFNTDLGQYNNKVIYVNNASTAHPYTTKTYPQGYYNFDLSAPVSGAGYGGWSDYVDYTTGSIVRGSDIDNAFRQMIYNNYRQYIDVVSASGYDLVTVMCEAKCYGVYMDDIYTANTQITLTGNEPALKDAPYRMFAMPYNDNAVQWTHVNGSTTITSDKNVNMSIAQAISAKLSGTWLYDLQLVPYCPFANSSSIISVSGGTVSIDCSQFDSSQLVIANGNVAVMIFCYQSEVKNLEISHTIPAASTAKERKVNNQCDMYRLCSPSYSSIYEFNAERNLGVSKFDVDFNYKPHDTYVHVAPYFNGLYGEAHTTENDIEGLICAGSFSLPQTSSQWQQYVLNNLNYRNTFNNDIKLMDNLHKYDKTENIIRAITGTAQGAVTGAAAGSAGGIAGMAAGAVLGGAASGAAGIYDVYAQEQRYGLNKNRQIERFNEGNRNVQARNQTLNNVSSYNANNKYFPVLEYYTCTDDEKEAFRKYLDWNGMTIERYGKIADLLSSNEVFVKGNIIRLEGLEDDYHMTAEIANEINEGVFI